MTQTKDFPTPDVMSVVTGIVVSERLIGAVYDVLNWMTGESLYTHQLPRVMREAAPVLLSLRPEFAQAVAEAASVDGSNALEWAARWSERYGPTIAVPRLTPDEHERIDPLSELVERVHPGKIIVVKP